ncbi:Double-stranded RNA-binding protein 4 [Forsythia ovata]|uniref:Double-stranded RNA-binding protein 4 n=1 Tax=Forsythia ovata TaxID=205694 RepID=A0ABD1SR51_9LAMI
MHNQSQNVLHIYKNRLQQYAQKKSLGLPVYTYESEGPPHARRFKSVVSLDGKIYEAPAFFPTLKDAEHAAAKVACQALSIVEIPEDKGLYKNQLQGLAQKRGLKNPSYETTTAGLSHKPVFVSTVEIGSDTFQGTEAKTKKQAEINAAEVAYIALSESSPVKEALEISSSMGSTAATDLKMRVADRDQKRKYGRSMKLEEAWC